MDYRAVLFDFDYTLADATQSIYEGYCYSFGEMGLPVPSLERVREMVGYILEDSYTMLTGDKDPVRRAECRRLFQEKVGGRQAEKTVLCTGAAELLHALRDSGVKMGIISSKRSSTLREILEYHHLMDLMELVVGPDMVKRPKPDPEGLERAVELLGVDKAAAIPSSTRPRARRREWIFPRCSTASLRPRPLRPIPMYISPQTLWS